jgi:hypothetical protein
VLVLGDDDWLEVELSVSEELDGVVEAVLLLEDDGLVDAVLRLVSVEAVFDCAWVDWSVEAVVPLCEVWPEVEP